ncbi:MAG: hypothetical protein AB1813_06740 [Verrucomicrobiota bacterium]
MKSVLKLFAPAALAAGLILTATSSFAQERPNRGGGGGFDPEQMRQRMMERYREVLGVKSDDEWKLIQTRIEKISDARREVGGGFGAMFGGRGGRGGAGGGGGDNDGGRRGARGGSSPEAEELQKAIESNASADEIKAKLAKLRDTRKEKEAKLEEAQEELRKVLTVKQEAAAVLAGLLK